MRKTRLFPTLVLFGASLTGAGAIATVATVSVTVSGCGDDTTSSELDMSGHYFDIGVPFVRDLSMPPDLNKGD